MAASIGARLIQMLQDEDMTDVKFVIEDTEIRAHKVICSNQGGMLKEMLQNNEEEIKIADAISPNIFKIVLQYLYTDACELTNENLFEVTHAAKILQLPRLEKYCSEFVGEKLTLTNLYEFTEQAILFEVKDGVKVCQEYFRRHTEAILKTQEFLNFSEAVLVALCGSEGITCSEVELFSACLQWAKIACQRQGLGGTPAELRTALGGALSKIRFMSMTLNQFLKVVVPSEILFYEEVGQIIVSFEKQDQRSTFSNIPRTEEVQVNVAGYASGYIPNSSKKLPLSTTIKEVKEKCYEYPVNSYTLSDQGQELGDEMTLASVYTSGETVSLAIHSVTVNVQDNASSWELPCTLKADICNAKGQSFAENIIKGTIFGHKGIEPQTLKPTNGEDCYGRYNFSYHHLTPGSSVNCQC